MDLLLGLTGEFPSPNFTKWIGIIEFGGGLMVVICPV
jgi:hypothetical protein